MHCQWGGLGCGHNNIWMVYIVKILVYGLKGLNMTNQMSDLLMQVGHARAHLFLVPSPGALAIGSLATGQFHLSAHNYE